jgi:hypothetical protein
VLLRLHPVLEVLRQLLAQRDVEVARQLALHSGGECVCVCARVCVLVKMLAGIVGYIKSACVKIACQVMVMKQHTNKYCIQYVLNIK